MAFQGQYAFSSRKRYLIIEKMELNQKAPQMNEYGFFVL